MIFNTKIDFLNSCPNGRLIALDVGTKNIGVAITDDTRRITTPIETISRKGNKKDFPIILNLIKEKKVKGIIIGLPLSFDESENESSLFIRRFTENLLKEVIIPVFFQDERLSSFEAEDLMLDSIGFNETKKVVDKIAASYILESFLAGWSLLVFIVIARLWKSRGNPYY